MKLYWTFCNLMNYGIQILSLFWTLFFYDNWICFNCGRYIVFNRVDSASRHFVVHVPLLSRCWWVKNDLWLSMLRWNQIFICHTATVLNYLFTHILKIIILKSLIVNHSVYRNYSIFVLSSKPFFYSNESYNFRFSTAPSANSFSAPVLIS